MKYLFLKTTILFSSFFLLTAFSSPIVNDNLKIKKIVQENGGPTTITLWSEYDTFYVYGMTVENNFIHCDYLRHLATVSPGNPYTKSVSGSNTTFYIKVQETKEKCGIRNNDSEYYIHGNQNVHNRYELD